MGEELNVSIHHEKLLTAMGIQVWYRRGKSTMPVPASHEQTQSPIQETSQPKVSPPAQAVHEPKVPADAQPAQVGEAESREQAQSPQQLIEFIWWRGRSGMILLEPMQMLDEKLLHDIVIALDWLATKEVGKASNGHFKWPQLATSTGSPERAMLAFFDTNGPEEMAWLLVSDGLFDDLETFFPESVKVSKLSGSIHLAQQKRVLWQALAR